MYAQAGRDAQSATPDESLDMQVCQGYRARKQPRQRSLPNRDYRHAMSVGCGKGVLPAAGRDAAQERKSPGVPAVKCDGWGNLLLSNFHESRQETIQVQLPEGRGNAGSCIIL